MAKAASITEPTLTPVRRDKPELGLGLSLVLHGLVVVGFAVSWPFMKQEPLETPPLIVDLVEIAEVSAAPPKPTPKVEEEQPKPEPEKPTEATAPKTEEPPPPEPTKPTPPPPEPKPEPPPLKVQVPPPKPQPPKKKDDFAKQMTDLLKTIEKAQPKKQEPNQTVADAKVNNQTAVASDRATMTELDAIRSRIESCWRLDPGKEGIENLSALIRVSINPDGSVQSALIQNQTRYFDDATFRTFADGARMSVLACKGIPITPQHYEQLKEMDLNFSPQGLIR